MASNYGNDNIVTNGLVLCVDANDKNSYIPNTTTVHDLANSHIGSGSNGLSGSAGYWVYGGEAANSTGEHIDFGDLGVTNIYAIGCWFYTNSSTNNGTTNFSLFRTHNDESNRGSSLMFGSFTGLVSGETICLAAYQSGHKRTAVTNITIGSGWHHILLNWDSGNSRYSIYLDNVSQTLTAGSSGNVELLTSTDFNIGRGYNLSDPVLNGRIACTHVYSNALSDLEIEQNFNAQRHRFGI